MIDKDRIRELHDAGVPYTEMANILGVSRGSISGYIHRMDLKRRGKKPFKRGPDLKPRKRTPPYTYTPKPPSPEIVFCPAKALDARINLQAELRQAVLNTQAMTPPDDL